MGRYERSLEWYHKIREVIPCGANTGAKRPDAYGELKDHLPYYIARAKGARFWDVDGNEFVDYRAALGPVILGHAYDEVDEAVRQQMEKGALYSMREPAGVRGGTRAGGGHPLRRDGAFSQDGGDAISACVRLA